MICGLTLCHRSDVAWINSMTHEIGSQQILCVVSCVMDFCLLTVPFFLSRLPPFRWPKNIWISNICSFVEFPLPKLLYTFDILAHVDQLLQSASLWTMINFWVKLIWTVPIPCRENVKHFVNFHHKQIVSCSVHARNFWYKENIIQINRLLCSWHIFSQSGKMTIKTINPPDVERNISMMMMMMMMLMMMMMMLFGIPYFRGFLLFRFYAHWKNSMQNYPGNYPATL